MEAGFASAGSQSPDGSLSPEVGEEILNGLKFIPMPRSITKGFRQHVIPEVQDRMWDMYNHKMEMYDAFNDIFPENNPMPGEGADEWGGQ